MATEQPAPTIEETDAIHTHFGLSYATHLVMPRTILQSMPDWWQRDFVHLLRLYDHACSGLPENMQDVNYRVQTGEWREPWQVDDDTLKRLGWSYGDEDDTDATADPQDEEDPDEPLRTVIYDPEGNEHSIDTDCVFVPNREDPIPHYWRGRTRLPLAPITRTDVSATEDDA